MRIQTFLARAKANWITLEIILVILVSFIIHMPYFFQYTIIPAFCTDQNNQKTCEIETQDEMKCYSHDDKYDNSDLFLAFSLFYSVSRKCTIDIFLLVFDESVQK